MQKIFKYQDEAAKIEIEYHPDLNFKNRKYILRIIENNKELLNYELMVDLAGNTTKSRYQALDRLKKDKELILKIAKNRGSKIDLLKAGYEIDSKAANYWAKYEELKEKNLSKGIYYFN